MKYRNKCATTFDSGLFKRLWINYRHDYNYKYTLCNLDSRNPPKTQRQGDATGLRSPKFDIISFSGNFVTAGLRDFPSRANRFIVFWLNITLFSSSETSIFWSHDHVQWSRDFFRFFVSSNKYQIRFQSTHSLISFRMIPHMPIVLPKLNSGFKAIRGQ